MSGGCFDFKESNLAEDLFGYNLYISYGDTGRQQSRRAREINPMRDHEISELVWDVLCLIRSLDYFESSDISEEDYLNDIHMFKDKWLNRTDACKESYIQDLKEYCDTLISEIKR